MHIYDDRLEIINPGLLPEDLTFESLKKAHLSRPRNANITKAFNKGGYIESVGMGTQEIIQACTKSSLQSPEFFNQAGHFAIRFWSKQHMDKDVRAPSWD